MKRFKIEYTVNGESVELFAEAMDLNHRMFSVERKDNDPHPLLIEHTGAGWSLKSQDDWRLSADDVSKLGELLEKGFHENPKAY